jgi:hypothetical protein
LRWISPNSFFPRQLYSVGVRLTGRSLIYSAWIIRSIKSWVMCIVPWSLRPIKTPIKPATSFEVHFGVFNCFNCNIYVFHKALTVFSLISQSSGPDWQSQTPSQPRLSQTMRRAFSYDITLWLRSEEPMSSDRQTTSSSSEKSSLNSTFQCGKKLVQTRNLKAQ